MNSYEIQANETAPAFQAFQSYRDMGLGLRSTAKVAQELGKSKTLIDRWSGRWNWVARVRDYDRDLDVEIRERHSRELWEARDRHANLARLMQSKFLDRMREVPPEEIPIPVLTNMLRISTDVELRALGDSLGKTQTEISGPNGVPIQAEIAVGLLNDLIKDPESRYALDHIAQRMESDPSVTGHEVVEWGLDTPATS